MMDENINNQVGGKDENITDNNNGKSEEKNKGEEETAVWQKKAEEYLNGWKRAKADYINLKKESEERYSQLIKFANAGLILEILPVLDNFKLSLAHIPDEHKKLDWVIGILHIKSQLENVLKNLGIEEIKTLGEKFNPELHEAIQEEKAEIEGGEHGIIVKELRPGYTMHGKVIQAAKVVVS